MAQAEDIAARRERFLLAAFTLLLAIGLVTVVWPELRGPDASSARDAPRLGPPDSGM
ncbi:MAG: hypothetical protein RL385_3554 [Pseudomonadota bacterium]|jgi:hypothetical protein